MSSSLLVLHSMFYFFHHFELPHTLAYFVRADEPPARARQQQQQRDGAAGAGAAAPSPAAAAAAADPVLIVHDELPAERERPEQNDVAVGPNEQQTLADRSQQTSAADTASRSTQSSPAPSARDRRASLDDSASQALHPPI